MEQVKAMTKGKPLDAGDIEVSRLPTPVLQPVSPCIASSMRYNIPPAAPLR